MSEKGDLNPQIYRAFYDLRIHSEIEGRLIAEMHYLHRPEIGDAFLNAAFRIIGRKLLIYPAASPTRTRMLSAEALVREAALSSGLPVDDVLII